MTYRYTSMFNYQQEWTTVTVAEKYEVSKYYVDQK